MGKTGCATEEKHGKGEIVRRIGMVVLAALLGVLGTGKTAWAGQRGQAPGGAARQEETSFSMDDLPGSRQFDFSGIDRFLQGEEAVRELTLETVMEYLIQGKLSELCREIMSGIRRALFSEISAGSRLMGQILALGILGAVFTNFSAVFQESRISETGFFITYLLLFTFLVLSLTESVTLAADTVKDILEFMRVLMPSYFLAVAFAGGSASAVVMYEFTLWAMTAGQWFLCEVMLPLARVYVLLGMAGNLAKEEFLSKMTELLEHLAGWGLKTVPGLILGFQLIQSLILPYVDSMKQGAVQKAVAMIPGIGQGASAMTQLLTGAGVLIKNTMGMAAVVILFTLIALPVLKLVILLLLYQCVAAVMEPVCDKRLVKCVWAAAKGQKLMVRTVAASALILVITVAVVCAGTNVTYYA